MMLPERELAKAWREMRRLEGWIFRDEIDAAKKRNRGLRYPSQIRQDMEKRREVMERIEAMLSRMPGGAVALEDITLPDGSQPSSSIMRWASDLGLVTRAGYTQRPRRTQSGTRTVMLWQKKS